MLLVHMPQTFFLFFSFLFVTKFSCAQANAEHARANGNLLFLEKGSSLPVMSKDRLFSHLFTPTPLASVQ